MSINISVDTVIGEFGILISPLIDAQKATIGATILLVYDEEILGMHDFVWESRDVSWFIFFANLVKWAKSRCNELASDRETTDEIAVKAAEYRRTADMPSDESDPLVPL